MFDRNNNFAARSSGFCKIGLRRILLNWETEICNNVQQWINLKIQHLHTFTS